MEDCWLNVHQGHRRNQRRIICRRGLANHNRPIEIGSQQCTLRCHHCLLIGRLLLLLMHRRLLLLLRLPLLLLSHMLHSVRYLFVSLCCYVLFYWTMYCIVYLLTYFSSICQLTMFFVFICELWNLMDDEMFMRIECFSHLFIGWGFLNIYLPHAFFYEVEFCQFFLNFPRENRNSLTIDAH